MADLEKKMTQMNDGRTARLILSHLSPTLEKLKLESEAQFLNEFSSGSLDLSKSLAYAAKLSTIRDIENELRSKINVSDRLITEGQNERDRSDPNEFSI